MSHNSLPTGSTLPSDRLPSFGLGLGVALLAYFVLAGGVGVGDKITLMAGVVSASVAAAPSLFSKQVKPVRLRDVLAVAGPTLTLALAANWLHQAVSDQPLTFGEKVVVAEGKVTVVDAVTTPGKKFSGAMVFRPRLSPKEGQGRTGDCVIPAVLTIAPIIDGLNTGTWTAPYADKVSIPIADEAQKVKLRISLEVPGDNSCSAILDFEDGSLDRRFLGMM